ncbi:MAG: hypothetical protein K0B00_14045 [Rhodobacteraceae bacterium]|nr:hypothetical protein [Paracoccaceae bacterium]
MFSEVFFDVRTENDLRSLAARPAIRPACVSQPVAGRGDAASGFVETAQGTARSVWHGVPGALFGLVAWVLVAAALFVTVPALVHHDGGDTTRFAAAPNL